MEKPTAILGNARQNTLVVDADESTRPRLEGAGHKTHQDHITEKRDDFTEPLHFGTQVYSDASRMENSGCEGGRGEIMRRNWRKSQHGS